jgi:hypothetical protein
VKRSSVGVTTPSLRRGHRQRTVTTVCVLASLATAIITEKRLAELFDDHLIATMLMLIASIVTIALVLPFVTRTR